VKALTKKSWKLYLDLEEKKAYKKTIYDKKQFINTVKSKIIKKQKK